MQTTWAEETKPLALEELMEFVREGMESLKRPQPHVRDCCGLEYPQHWDWCIQGKLERGEITCK